MIRGMNSYHLVVREIMMKMRAIIWGLGVALCGVSGQGAANDAVASLGAGGIVIGKTDAIAMEQEDLFISKDKIRVAYVFRNTSAQDITTRVAFPVPTFPEHPETDLSLDVNTENPMGFSVKVEGKTKVFETETKKQNGKVSITHHWMQTFPTGKTLAVTHEYKPAIGGEALLSFEGEERARKIKRYCLESDFVKWIEKNNHPEKGMYLSSQYVDYILTTGANWKGAIGQFRLTVQKARAEEKLSFCGTGLKKVDAKTFVMEKKNFIPIKDLAIMFVSKYTTER